MSEAKYKIGQELQTADGDRHVVEEVRYRYVVRRVHAVRSPGVRPGIGCLNSYDESDLAPYVRPLVVGDRVRHTRYRDRDGNPWDGVIIDMMDTLVVVRHSDSFSVFPTVDLVRIPTEANQ